MATTHTGIFSNGGKTYVIASKYSPVCSKFVKKVVDNNIDFIHVLYVDSHRSRDLTKNSFMDIHTVPCVIEFQHEGIAKYDNERAFAWLDSIIESKKMSDPPSNMIASEASIAVVGRRKKIAGDEAMRMMKDREEFDNMAYNTRMIKSSVSEIGEAVPQKNSTNNVNSMNNISTHNGFDSHNSYNNYNTHNNYNSRGSDGGSYDDLPHSRASHGVAAPHVAANATNTAFGAPNVAGAPNEREMIPTSTRTSSEIAMQLRKEREEFESSIKDEQRH